MLIHTSGRCIAQRACKVESPSCFSPPSLRFKILATPLPSQSVERAHWVARKWSYLAVAMSQFRSARLRVCGLRCAFLEYLVMPGAPASQAARHPVSSEAREGTPKRWPANRKGGGSTRMAPHDIRGTSAPSALFSQQYQIQGENSPPPDGSDCHRIERKKSFRMVAAVS